MGKYFTKEAKTLARVVGKNLKEHAKPEMEENLVKVKKIDQAQHHSVVSRKADSSFKNVKSKARKGYGTMGGMLGMIPGIVGSGSGSTKARAAKLVGSIGTGVAGGALYGGHKANKHEKQLKSKYRVRGVKVREHLKKRKSQGADVYADPSILGIGEY